MSLQVERFRKHSVEDLLTVHKDSNSKIQTSDDLHNIKQYYQKIGGDFLIMTFESSLIGMCGYLPQNYRSVIIKRFQIKESAYNIDAFNKMLTFLEEQVIARGFRSLLVEFNSGEERFFTHFIKSGFKIKEQNPHQSILEKKL